MVSEDLLETLGLTLETSTKAVEAVDGGRVTCLGSSPVEIQYQGRIAQTRLLVTDALRSEVILSKTVLEKLEVIDQDFPNARARDGKRYPNPDPGWGCNRTPKGYHTSGLVPEDHTSGLRKSSCRLAQRNEPGLHTSSRRLAHGTSQALAKRR